MTEPAWVVTGLAQPVPPVKVILTDPTTPDGLPTFYLADYAGSLSDGVQIFKTRDPVMPTTTELQFLEEWLRFWHEPAGQECCGNFNPETGCCGNSVLVYNTPDDVRAAMNARHAELVANLTKPA